jgi:ACR3 family arsenite efflux pump ArsB
VSIAAKLQPLFIIAAAGAGILAGTLSPVAGRHAGAFIEPFLMLMLFFVFLSADMRAIRRSFADKRFAVSALLINFVWNPAFAFLLAKRFLSQSADLQIGFIMLMVTPCTDWYLIFTSLAKGNTALGASILPLNLVAQIALLPLYLLFFMGEAASFTAGIIIQSLVMVLIIPAASANLLKAALKKTRWRRLTEKTEKIAGKSEGLQFFLLCCAVAAMFSSQGSLLLSRISVFAVLAPPLILFFAVNGAAVFWAGRLLGLSYQDRAALVFTASARNSPVSLAVAAVTFPSRPVVSLVLVMGPLLELPLLAINAGILRKRAGF